MRIVIADDHPVVLMGLRTLLEELRAGYEVVGEACNGSELKAVLARHTCDLLITDFSMPSSGDEATDGLMLAHGLHQHYSGLPIIVLTMLSNVALVKGMLAAGVKGVVEKGSMTSELHSAIQSVGAGGTYVSQRLREKLRENGGCDGAHSHENGSSSTLSPREAEVLRLLACGLTVSEVAHHVGRSVKTISQQKHDAMRKLGIDGEGQLFEYMRLNGLWFC
ncbi:response regulator transcription factor [Dyella acidisoli]|uniref:DNA-binding response regulator n=1 Tax=Dyella acidisoli TaxID=1867834 RepID=A0ABQ5XKG5_9GAMM|nr:response regulator transcription factor [Dyella acidisoli]GLQ91689.1 DNA-binding response regulator [Dyella acidisoli]